MLCYHIADSGKEKLHEEETRLKGTHPHLEDSIILLLLIMLFSL